MIRPDLIITQIKHIDYPLFRATLTKHRDFFGKIIIYFNENNRFPYLDHFMHEALEPLGNIKFLDQSQISWGTEDWRNVSTNEMLKHSDGEWLCSVEQDWFSKDWDSLLSMVSQAMNTNDLVGWGATSGIKSFYIHPAFWFMKRSVLDKTTKDFSARDGEDHFGHITRDAEGLGAKIFCIERDGGLNCTPSPEADAFHLGGVNQNYLNFEDLFRNKNVHRAEAFYTYNYYCMKANVPQSPVFMKMMEEVHEKQYTIVPEMSEWKHFFEQ